MRRKTLLVVEDEEDILQLLSYTLTKAGFRVVLAQSGEEALEKLGGEPIDLALLDMMLPGINGQEVCQAIRRSERLKNIPVVMLTAKSEEDDIICGLAGGADDYVTKPFSPQVLVARLLANLRRRGVVGTEDGNEQAEPLQLGDLFLDPARFEATVGGKPVVLTLTEFDILKLLARRPGWVFTRPQIIDDVRGYEYSISLRTVDVHMSSLRKKLGPAGRMIESVRGLGYRLKA
ncbi:MAG TPA: response regulator transcription factor [Desulfurivibrio alkaliphilus]|uniref:Response regulator transcription factor n=1 Tax=Desulfurivibrio alkaliphilus TaxID=427923 RepID=A0A7C2TKU2_9BACT|nr:response regulator transcription factor [Desulfurivibrio alkaliphilus]